MKKNILYPLEYLFVSSCNFSKNINTKGDFYDAAYLSISLLMSVNLFSFMMLLKYFIGFELNMGKIIFFIVFFSPALILNHYIFMRKKRYLILYKEIKTTSMGFIIYLFFTLIFFIITGYINIS